MKYQPDQFKKAMRDQWKLNVCVQDNDFHHTPFEVLVKNKKEGEKITELLTAFFNYMDNLDYWGDSVKLNTEFKTLTKRGGEWKTPTLKQEHRCEDHIVTKTNKYFPTLTDITCSVCKSSSGEDGWLCAASPDGNCHYYTKDGKVILKDGTKVEPPKDEEGNPHNSEYETEDDCIFCHQPEERQ